MSREERLLFAQALFDDRDKIAFGSDNKTAYYAQDWNPYFLFTNAEKFCINPIHKIRNGENVTHVNSILVECDDKSIDQEEQIARFKESGMPYTTMVWSGTKSIHAIIRLTEPIYLEDFDMKKQLYKNWHAAIRTVLKKYGLNVDDSTDKLPQLSRVPGSMRQSSQTMQTLVYIGKRINPLEVIQWLQKHDVQIDQPIKHVPQPWTEGANDRVSNIRKWKLATSWTQKKHGIYSTYMQTGAYLWLFNLGVNTYKLDLGLEAAQQLAELEWGTQFKGSNGVGNVRDAIEKGYTYSQKNRIERIELV